MWKKIFICNLKKDLNSIFVDNFLWITYIKSAKISVSGQVIHIFINIRNIILLISVVIYVK